MSHAKELLAVATTVVALGGTVVDNFAEPSPMGPAAIVQVEQVTAQPKVLVVERLSDVDNVGIDSDRLELKEHLQSIKELFPNSPASTMEAKRRAKADAPRAI